VRRAGRDAAWIALVDRDVTRARPQDVVAAVFGLEFPAFYLTRERFIYAD